MVTAGSGLPFTLSVFPGAGAGVLGARQDYLIGGQTTAMDVADLNNDGLKDVVVTTNSNTVVVFLNPHLLCREPGMGLYLLLSLPHLQTGADRKKNKIGAGNIDDE